MICMGAAYSPKKGEPLNCELPVELPSGRLRIDVWNRWLVHDPVRFVPKHADVYRKLKSLFIDCGTRDEFNLRWGARLDQRRAEGRQRRARARRVRRRAHGRQLPLRAIAGLAGLAARALKEATDMKLLVREVIDETLGALKAAGSITFDAMPAYNIEVPKNLDHGDWSCNVCDGDVEGRGQEAGRVRRADHQGPGRPEVDHQVGREGRPRVLELPPQGLGVPGGRARGAQGAARPSAGSSRSRPARRCWWSSCRPTPPARCTSVTRAAPSWATPFPGCSTPPVTT